MTGKVKVVLGFQANKKNRIAQDCFNPKYGTVDVRTSIERDEDERQDFEIIKADLADKEQLQRQ